MLVIACVAPGSGAAAEAPDLGAGAHLRNAYRMPMSGALVGQVGFDGVDWGAEAATEKLVTSA